MSTPFLEIITATFAAGEVKTYIVGGGYFEIIDAPYPVTVRLVDRYGTVRGQMNNAEASFYMKQGEFDAIEITSANSQTIRFAYGSSEAGTRRTSGVVQVVDSSKIRTQSGLAFVGSFGISAVAGVASSCVLWNPAGSGKNVYIERVRVSLTSAATYGSEHISALGGGLTQDAATIVPKKIGSVAATQGWKTTAASFAGVSQPFNSIFTALLGANAIDVGDLYEPVLIVPGSGFRIFCGTVNVGMIASAEFFEEAI